MVLKSIVSSYLSSNKLHSVHPSSHSAGGGLSLLLNFQKEGLDRISVLKFQDLRGWVVAAKIGVTFFRRVADLLLISNKKSTILQLLGY